MIYDQITYVIGYFCTFYYISIGNFDTATWPTVFQMPIPIDTTSIFGWYLVYTGDTIMDIIFMLGNILATTYFVSCCFYIDAICDHFEFCIASIQTNLDGRHESLPDVQMTKKIDTEIMDRINQAIRIHYEILE